MSTGNHEATDINALFGFRTECQERLGVDKGQLAWQRVNALFNWLPLAACIEDKVLCMHGGTKGKRRFMHDAVIFLKFFMLIPMLPFN